MLSACFLRCAGLKFRFFRAGFASAAGVVFAVAFFADLPGRLRAASPCNAAMAAFNLSRSAISMVSI